MLTDTWLRANLGKPREKTLVKADRDGLGARVSPTGKITWQYRYRLNGSAKRIDIGTYPATALRAARDEAIRLNGVLEGGRDPGEVRIAERLGPAAAITVERLVRDWYATYCAGAKKTAPQILRSFELYIFPPLGSLPADSVSASAWMDVLESVKGKYPAIADRLLVNAKQALQWGVRRQVIRSSPLMPITAKADLGIIKLRRTRVLTDDELRLVWESLHESRIAHRNRLFVILCMAYGCRNGELRIARKVHFDLVTGVWTIPPENHKTGKVSGKPLLRPIFPAVRPIIEELIGLSGGPWLMPNEEGNGPLQHSAPVQIPINLMQWLRRRRSYEMVHWSLHDLRRTARTRWSRLASWNVAEIMVGHVLPGESQTYDHHDYMEEQRAAYEQWWAVLMGIVAGVRQPDQAASVVD